MFKIEKDWYCFNQLPPMDPGDATIDDVDYFTEDLFQIRIPNAFTIDVGWTKHCDLQGYFICLIIKNQDWENPLFSEKFRKLSDVENWINTAIQFAHQCLELK